MPDPRYDLLLTDRVLTEEEIRVLVGTWLDDELNEIMQIKELSEICEDIATPEFETRTTT